MRRPLRANSSSAADGIEPLDVEHVVVAAWRLQPVIPVGRLLQRRGVRRLVTDEGHDRSAGTAARGPPRATRRPDRRSDRSSSRTRPGRTRRWRTAGARPARAPARSRPGASPTSGSTPTNRVPRRRGVEMARPRLRSAADVEDVPREAAELAEQMEVRPLADGEVVLWIGLVAGDPVRLEHLPGLPRLRAQRLPRRPQVPCVGEPRIGSAARLAPGRAAVGDR